MAAESPKLHVNDLNDDCLVHIFTFLPMRERVRIERVCKRWFNVSPLARNFAEELTFFSGWRSRPCFRNMANFKNRGTRGFYVGDENARIVEYLKYAGRSLRKLNFPEWPEWCYKTICYPLTVMTKYCPNITSLSLGSNYPTEIGLIILAENCTQLEQLSLIVSQHDHERESLIKLFQNNCNLRELNLLPGSDCDISHELNYLSKKSIESVSFTGTSLEWAIGCERLQHLELHFGYDRDCYSIVRLVACTTLQHLEIYPENRDLEFCGSWISHLRNLQSLILGLDLLDCETDVYPLITIIVQNCRNIRAVHVSGTDRILADDELAALASLPLLEYLSIEGSLRIRGKLGCLQNIKHVFFQWCDQLKVENLARFITLSPTLETLSMVGQFSNFQIFCLAKECAKNCTNNVTLQLNYEACRTEDELWESFQRSLNYSQMCALGNGYFFLNS